MADKFRLINKRIVIDSSKNSSGQIQIYKPGEKDGVLLDGYIVSFRIHCKISSLIEFPNLDDSPLKTTNQLRDEYYKKINSHPCRKLCFYSSMDDLIKIPEFDVLIYNKRPYYEFSLLPSWSDKDPFRVGHDTTLWCEIGDYGYGKFSTDDRVIIKIDASEEAPKEDSTTYCQSRQPFGVDLPEGVPTQILAQNNNRKYLILTNDSANKIYWIFGTAQELENNLIMDNSIIIGAACQCLLPGQSITYTSEGFVEAAPVSAVAIGGNGFLSGQSGN